MIRFITVVAIASSLDTAAAAPPLWGGSDKWSSTVDMTNPADSKTHPSWKFNYYYDSRIGAELYHHGVGQGDEICHAVTDGGECHVLNHPDGHAYITDVSADKCCKFYMHLGAILPDWLERSNATYAGEQEINGVDARVWIAGGQYTNNYGCTGEGDEPIRFWEYKGEVGDEMALKQWDFVQDSYCAGDDCFDNDEMFAKPPNCERICVNDQELLINVDRNVHA